LSVDNEIFIINTTNFGHFVTCITLFKDNATELHSQLREWYKSIWRLPIAFALKARQCCLYSSG